MLKSAQEVIASGNDRFVVDYAIEVNRQITAFSKELSTVKKHLRKLGLSRVVAGKRSVAVEGNLGVGSTPKVIVPK
jgi:hypothetical protein